MTAAFREQLLSAAHQAAFPADPLVDPETGADILDPQAAADTQAIFDLFGVTGIKPNDPDIDKILNTVCTLATEVAVHVEGLDAVAGDTASLSDAAGWHPDYRAYVEALWQGDRAEIARLASALGVSGGIPNGSPALKDGPLG